MTETSQETDASAEEARSDWRELGPVGLLGILWSVVPGVLGITLLVYLGTVSDWLRANPGVALPVYCAAFATTAGFGVLPTYAQAILGGWVFGFAAGFPAALLGFTLAALLGYGIARLVARDTVMRRIGADPRARTVHEALVGRSGARTLGVVTLLRVPPNSPFALTNLAMAGTRVGVLPFVAGTALGMAPRTVVYVGMGAGGAASGARGLGEFVKEGPGWIVMVVGIVLMLCVLGILSNIANRALERLTPDAEGEAAQ